MREELKPAPCPFCGKSYFITGRGMGSRAKIRCTFCEADGPVALDGEAQAIERWNTRSNPPQEERSDPLDLAAGDDNRPAAGTLPPGAIAGDDDGLTVYLDSFAGGGNRLGAWGDLSLRFTRPGEEDRVRWYTANDLARRPPAQPAADDNHKALVEALRPFASDELIRRAEEEHDAGRCIFGPAACVRYMTTLGALYAARDAIAPFTTKETDHGEE